MFRVREHILIFDKAQMSSIEPIKSDNDHSQQKIQRKVGVEYHREWYTVDKYYQEI